MYVFRLEVAKLATDDEQAKQMLINRLGIAGSAEMASSVASLT